MVNIIETIYDSVKQHIEEHIEDYVEELNLTEGYRLPHIENVFRHYMDVYSLPTYPSIVFGYGQITLSDEHTTTAEHWQVPISLYAVASGGDAELVQKMVEAYAFILFSIFSGEDNTIGIVNITGMGTSPVMSRENQIIQIGYVDITIDVSVQRKQT